jgi:hypothetical protein
MMSKLGIDCGFGDVKVVTESGRQFKFPTSVSRIRSSIDIGASDTSDVFEYNGDKFRVGRIGVEGSIPTRSKSFLLNYSPLFVARAIKDSGEKVNEISVGLALNHYTCNGGHFRRELEEKLSEFTINDELFKQRVNIVPQAVGILGDFCLTERGMLKEGAEVDGLVLDIGYNTIDVVCFEKGRAISTGFGCLEGEGVCCVIEPLADHVQANHGVSISAQEAQKIFATKSATFFGNTHDYAEAIDQMVGKYVSEMFCKIEGKWANAVAKAQRVIIAGGGSYLVKDILPGMYRGTAHIPDTAEFSNARGFLKAIA